MRPPRLGTRLHSVKLASILRKGYFREADMFFTAASFRDTQLLPIFETAYDTLTELLHRTIPFDNRK